MATYANQTNCTNNIFTSVNAVFITNKPGGTDKQKVKVSWLHYV